MPAIDVDEYRNRYEQELERTRTQSTRTKGARSYTDGEPGDFIAVDDARDDLGPRVAQLLAVATDRDRKIDDRLDALQALSALEFLGARFSPYRAEWVSTLRTLAEDPRATVRRSALEQLALRQDPHARELLLTGLDKPASALVPDAVALQFLGHDGHGDAVPAARKVYRRSKGAAREEALRILATDPGSAAMLERLMKDKSEKSSVRRISAAALQDLDPSRFEKAARRVVADDDDFNEIRSTSLTGLALRRTAESAPDDALVQTVTKLHSSSRSPAVKASASRFLAATRDRSET
ncbi:MAG TPA: hypothetical protein VJM33_08325 [Microthrixaceae bacterium]|nr:hypothetical protein [Microthrixaceae bacterium]